MKSRDTLVEVFACLPPPQKFQKALGKPLYYEAEYARKVLQYKIADRRRWEEEPCSISSLLLPKS